MTNQNAALRRQMIGSLTEDDLRGLCLDYFPNIYADLTTGMTMSRMVELLLNGCARNGRYHDLRAALHRINPLAFPHVDPNESESTRLNTVQSDLVEQFTAVITPPFAHSRIPITKIEVEVLPIQEKVNSLLTSLWLLTPLWTLVSLCLIVLLVFIVVLLTSSLPGVVNVTRLPMVQAVTSTFSNPDQSSPNPTLTAVQQSSAALQRIEEPAQLPKNPQLGARWLRPQDHMQMVYVPVNPPQLGNTSPQFNLTVVSPNLTYGFWLDQTEVSNQQYDLCVALGFCNESALAANADYHNPTYPVVGVSWFDATAYCTWVAGQLPTVSQWTHAAAGFQNSTFPWGEAEPTCDLAQFNDCEIGLASVGSKPDGQSWAGAYDLAGNVWEWVQADGGETAVDPPRDTPHVQMLRGGGWNSDPRQMQNSVRKFENPNNWLDHLGFRCVYPNLSP